MDSCWIVFPATLPQFFYEKPPLAFEKGPLLILCISGRTAGHHIVSTLATGSNLPIKTSYLCSHR